MGGWDVSFRFLKGREEEGGKRTLGSLRGVVGGVGVALFVFLLFFVKKVWSLLWWW